MGRLQINHQSQPNEFGQKFASSEISYSKQKVNHDINLFENQSHGAFLHSPLGPQKYQRFAFEQGIVPLLRKQELD
jgi:hypothetical protein